MGRPPSGGSPPLLSAAQRNSADAREGEGEWSDSSPVSKCYAAWLVERHFARSPLDERLRRGGIATALAGTLTTRGS